MDWDDPDHRRILEFEGLREWKRPRLDGYELAARGDDRAGIADRLVSSTPGVDRSTSCASSRQRPSRRKSRPRRDPDDPDEVEHVVDERRATRSCRAPAGGRGHPGPHRDPIEALAPEQPPGYRLWVYTNFHCNLACDYCCVASSPRADAGSSTLATSPTWSAKHRARVSSSSIVTGGEPSCSSISTPHPGRRRRSPRRCSPTRWLARRTPAPARAPAPPRLHASDQSRLGDTALHDRHRGEGSFAVRSTASGWPSTSGFRLASPRRSGPTPKTPKGS